MPTTQPRKRLSRALVVFTRDTAGRGNWGHPGLAKMLKDVGVDEARWKPAPDAHSIWEEVNHIAHWSRFVLDRLEGRGQPTKQAWPPGVGGAEGWRRAVGDVTRLHASLARSLGRLSDEALAAKYRSTRYQMAQLVLGCVAHIAYHVGQIAVLKRLYRHAGRAA
ncbi:MAG: DinB family protein [Armatimonadetes bacterium]|nr:DinB family protein [Armatimonadota bacterium]